MRAVDYIYSSIMAPEDDVGADITATTWKSSLRFGHDFEGSYVQIDGQEAVKIPENSNLPDNQVKNYLKIIRIPEILESADRYYSILNKLNRGIIEYWTKFLEVER